MSKTEYCIKAERFEGLVQDMLDAARENAFLRDADHAQELARAIETIIPHIIIVNNQCSEIE